MNSLKNMAHWTGLGYLLIFISAFFATGFVVEALVVAGDPAATWDNFKDEQFLLSMAILSFILMVIVDAVLAIPFYLILSSASKTFAMISSALRLVNAAVFAVALKDLVSFLRLLQVPPTDMDFVFRQVDYLTRSFDDTWMLGLIFFGLHLMILGYLLSRSKFFPSLLGVLIQLAGLVYIIDTVASFSFPAYTEYQSVFELMVVIPSVVGELSLCLWLLIKGLNLRSAQQDPLAD